MGATELVLKSPFFKGEFFSAHLSPLWQRGEGEIFGGLRRGLFGELLRQDTKVGEAFSERRFTIGLSRPGCGEHANPAAHFNVAVYQDYRGRGSPRRRADEVQRNVQG